MPLFENAKKIATRSPNHRNKFKPNSVLRIKRPNMNCSANPPNTGRHLIWMNNKKIFRLNLFTWYVCWIAYRAKSKNKLKISLFAQFQSHHVLSVYYSCALITFNYKKNNNFHEMIIKAKRILGLKLGQIQAHIIMTKRYWFRYGMLTRINVIWCQC